MPIPERVKKLWVVKEDKVIRVEELKDYESFTYNSKQQLLEKEDTKSIKIYRMFRDARIEALHNKIYSKKREWNDAVALSYKLNEDIGKLYDELELLKSGAKTANSNDDLFSEEEKISE